MLQKVDWDQQAFLTQISIDVRKTEKVLKVHRGWIEAPFVDE